MRYNEKSFKFWIDTLNEKYYKFDCHCEHHQFLEQKDSELPIDSEALIEGDWFQGMELAKQMGWIRGFANIAQYGRVSNDGKDSRDDHPRHNGTFIAFECIPELFYYCQSWLLSTKKIYDYVWFNDKEYNFDEFLCARNLRELSRRAA